MAEILSPQTTLAGITNPRFGGYPDRDRDFAVAHAAEPTPNNNQDCHVWDS